jgi:hypothetical protein
MALTYRLSPVPHQLAEVDIKREQARLQALTAETACTDGIALAHIVGNATLSMGVLVNAYRRFRDPYAFRRVESTGLPAFDAEGLHVDDLFDVVDLAQQQRGSHDDAPTLTIESDNNGGAYCELGHQEWHCSVHFPSPEEITTILNERDPSLWDLNHVIASQVSIGDSSERNYVPFGPAYNTGDEQGYYSVFRAVCAELVDQVRSV